MKATCLCSLTQGAHIISFKNDYSLEESAPVHFPEILTVAKLQGTSLFLIALVSTIIATSLIGSLIAYQMDKKDWSAIRNLSGWK